MFLAGLHPGDRDWVDQAVKATLDPAGDGTYDIAYRTIGLTDGVERWISAKGQAFFEQGRPVRFIGTVRDITESRQAEQTLRETEERYRLAARATNDAIWDWNLHTDHIRWNDAVRTLFGYAPEEVGPSGKWWTSRIHPDDRERIKTSIHAAIDGATENWTEEYRFLRADGSHADILDRGYVLRDEGGKAVRMIGAMLDITERKKAEEHQRLLTAELQHRVKNTLAMVQAIASQTLRGATDIDEAREAFSARLISLGRAHDILTQASWTAAPIVDVVEGALSVHRQADASRIRVNGPNVLLGAKPALSLALALHELATNAAKYGALSTANGAVDLRWHRRARGRAAAVLPDLDRAGRAADPEPTHRSGVRLAADRAQLRVRGRRRGKADIRADGSRMPFGGATRLDAGAARGRRGLVAASCAGRSCPPALKPSARLHDWTNMDQTTPPPAVALVAEDEFLLRMEAADTLSDAGFTVLEVASADDALRFLEDKDGVDLLFTDVNMPGRLDGFGLAREVALRWPGITIIVCSGAAKPLPGDLPAKARFIDKPYSPALVHEVVRELRAG